MLPMRWGDGMEKRFWPVSAVSVFVCGYVLFVAYGISGAASWSYLVSPVSHSPWELVKPFAWVYLFWSFIEMSVLRPPLLHYVCGRILSLHLFVLLGLGVLTLIPNAAAQEWSILLAIGSVLLVSQLSCDRLVRSRRRWELFFVPLLISFIMLFFCLLFLTVMRLTL